MIIEIRTKKYWFTLIHYEMLICLRQTNIQSYDQIIDINILKFNE